MSVRSLSDLGIAAQSMLEAFLPAHLAGLSRPLPAPTSYSLVPTADNIRQVQRAVCGVSAHGLSEPPSRNSDGSFDAWCVVNVFLFHEDLPDMPLSTATGDFAAAIAECLVQHPTLEGFAAGFQLNDYSADLVGDALTPKNLGLATVEAAVLVRNVVDRTPPGALPGPTVQSTSTVTTVR
jgi:hypothetical protein